MAHSDNTEITLEAAVWQYIQYLQEQKKALSQSMLTHGI